MRQRMSWTSLSETGEEAAVAVWTRLSETRVVSVHGRGVRGLSRPRSHNVQAPMGAEADALCGAGWGERSPDRVNQRNGYRGRRLDTRVGTLELAKTLDSEVAAFRARPLDAGPYAYVWLDALAIKCREAGRIVNVACVVATACNADGQREILGVDVLTSEDGAGWKAFSA
jgi:transposase-like protein